MLDSSFLEAPRDCQAASVLLDIIDVARRLEGDKAAESCCPVAHQWQGGR